MIYQATLFTSAVLLVGVGDISSVYLFDQYLLIFSLSSTGEKKTAVCAQKLPDLTHQES